MGEQRTRPNVKELKDAYDALFNSSLTINKVKDAALGGRLLVPSDSAAGVAGRSLAWKLFLVEAGPLQPHPPEYATIPLEALKSSRQEYENLFLEKMRAPDGGYEDGVIIPGTNISPPRTERNGGNLDLNNPLSLHTENPWTMWFASMDLRKTILQDVERTFPDIEYFRDPEVQAQLTNILFLYSVTHPDVGYRQGMHELLAPLYYAIDYDSISADDTDFYDHPLKDICSRVWVAADAWTLFRSVMRGVERWYEWREAKDTSVGKTPLPSHVQLPASPTDSGLKPYVAPIIDACNRMQSIMLKSVDPQLWKSLQSSGIEPQIYGIRWLRLLFTREFTMGDAMVLWDGLFACDPSFDLAPWVCVAMLIRIRNQLIPSDYSTQLTYLLRYPPLTSSSTTPIHPAALLLRQALTLQMSPTAATGVSVMHENLNMLNISIEVPEPPEPPMRRGRPRVSERGQSISNIASLKGSLDGTQRMHIRQGSNTMGLPEMIARGLLEKGESLGINKTVMHAVSELKRNLPDLANLPRLPTSPPATGTSYPLLDERAPSDRPPWEPRTRFEMEKEISDLKSLQKRLGDSVSWIVDTLLLDDGSADDQDKAKTIHERKREAVECLSYVRDVLKGTVPSTQIEEDRLVGEEEAKRRRAKTLEKERLAAAVTAAASTTPEPANAAPAIPQPAATAHPSLHSHPSPSTRRSHDYFTVGPSLTRVPVRVAPAMQAVHPRSPSPTPTVSILPPNQNAVPLAPWNRSFSSFSARDSPIASLPRLASKPPTSTSAPSSGSRATSSLPSSQTPSGGGRPRDQPPPRQQQDPLGVLR